MTINPTYIADPSGQQWQLWASDDGLEIVTTPVAGKVAVSSINLNDSLTIQSWVLTIIGPGPEWGEPKINEILPPLNFPTALPVISPGGGEFLIGIFDGELDLAPLIDLCDPPTSYYLSLITSQYQNSPKFLAWLRVPLEIICDINTCIRKLVGDFDIDLALGAQLDIDGQLIGVGRRVPFQPSGGVDPVLTDEIYRILLKAKIAQNQWNGQLQSLYGIWQTLFPGGTIALLDNQNMTATIFLTGVFSSILQDLIVNGMIIPRPEGVLYQFFFGDLPAFGFDHNDTYISGFDIGKWG